MNLRNSFNLAGSTEFDLAVGSINNLPNATNNIYKKKLKIVFLRLMDEFLKTDEV